MSRLLLNKQRAYFTGPITSRKIFKHAERVNEWLRGGNPPPVTVGIDITNRCNFHCPQCSYLGANRRWSLDRTLVFAILETLASVKVKGVVFSGGGEPLLHPQAVAIFQRAKELGLDVGLITNGLLITPENAEAILRSVEWVRISLDAGSVQDYGKVHGVKGETLFHVLDNLKLLAAVRAEKALPATIGASFIIGRANLGSVSEAARLVKEAGADYLQVKPMFIHADPINPWIFSFDRINYLPFIRPAFAQQSPGFQVLLTNRSLFLGRRKRAYQGCPGSFFSTQISPKGPNQAGIYMCCEYKGAPNFCLGSYSGTESFLEAWNAKSALLDNLDNSCCKSNCALHDLNQHLAAISSAYAKRGTELENQLTPLLHENFI